MCASNTNIFLQLCAFGTHSKISKLDCLNEIDLDGSKAFVGSKILCSLETTIHFITHALHVMRMKSFP
jgi:hypothetical protein